MGVFELHVHEPHLSVTVGEETESSLDWGTTTDGEGSSPPMGKLVPLFAVLAVVVLTALRRRRHRT